MGPKQLLGSIGAPGLCAKQTNIWTTERPAWGWADLQGPPLSGGWNHSLIPFHYSSPPPAPSLLPIHSLRIYPAASLTQHVSGQMSKNAPFNDTQQQEQEKKNPPLQFSPPCSGWLALSLLAFHSSWLIMSSSLSPWDSTCLSIGQHSLCEATWEPSHWALGPPWGLLREKKRKAKRGPG